MMQSTRLPESWVKSLLDRMAAMYGEKFVRQWEKTDPDAMRDMWADALGGFDGARIKWALTHLVANNPFPPTLPEFVMLCKQAPRPQAPALAAPVVPMEESRRRAEELDAAAKRLASGQKDVLGWAMRAPQAGDRGPWEKAIIELAESGDERFRKILAEHIRNGVIRSERAKQALEPSNEPAIA